MQVLSTESYFLETHEKNKLRCILVALISIVGTAISSQADENTPTPCGHYEGRDFLVGQAWGPNPLSDGHQVTAVVGFHFEETWEEQLVWLEYASLGGEWVLGWVLTSKLVEDTETYWSFEYGWYDVYEHRDVWVEDPC